MTAVTARYIIRSPLGKHLTDDGRTYPTRPDPKPPDELAAVAFMASSEPVVSVSVEQSVPSPDGSPPFTDSVPGAVAIGVATALLVAIILGIWKRAMRFFGRLRGVIRLFIDVRVPVGDDEAPDGEEKASDDDAEQASGGAT